jgi:hypothetical protein
MQTTPTKSILNNSPYITATYRGTEYTLSRLCDAWFVSTRRIALGRWNMGGGKYYATLAAVAAGCKAFGTESDLHALVYGVPSTVDA